MAYKADFKTTFEPSRVIQPIYTGGTVALSQNGRILATCLGEEALLTDLETGAHLARIEGDGEPITTLALTPDASFLAVCSRSLSLRIYALAESDDQKIDTSILRTLKPHTTPVVATAVDSTGSLLATGGADGTIKVWDIRGGYTTHTFHGHSGIVSALTFFQVDAEVDSRSKSNSKKRRSRSQDEETSNEQSTTGYRLASGGEDGKIKVWDLHKRKAAATLNGHVTIVRSLEFSPEQSLLVSASRDRTAILWNSHTWQQQSTIPVLESVESVGFLQLGQYIYTGGENSNIRIWSVQNGQEITEEQSSGTELESIVQVVSHPGLDFLLTVQADQTLLLHSLDSLKQQSKTPLAPLSVLRRISGTHDEVIDLAYIGADRNLLALATNAEDIRIVSLETTTHTGAARRSPYFGADIALLKGHKDIIISLAIDWSGHWLATGAKDNTARLWRLDPDREDYTCFTTFRGHAESIGAVALPNATPAAGSKEYKDPLNYPPKFLITGSQDKTVKRWNISAQPGAASKVAYTRKAHDKDINAIATSYSSNSTLFASASQDRTAKIWDAESGESIGELRGHKRGVWSVAFAPLGMSSLTQSEVGGASSSKGMVLTGSGDKTVRIWSLADHTCLRAFEGHANSVLKVVWLPPPAPNSRRGPQVASAAGDGLVKVWDAQTGECAATLDNHIDRVWALAVKPSSTNMSQHQFSAEDADMEESEETAVQGPQLELVSGSADSTLTFWTDTTALTAQAATQQATQRVEQDQELQNHIRANNYREAIILALQLNHPKRLLELFTAVISGPQEPGSLTGKKDVDDVISSLSDGQLWALFRRVRDWNANGRTQNVAQHILYAILRLIPKERLLSLRRRRRGVSTVEADEALAGAMSELSTKDQKTESVKDVLDGLKAYTERHYQRLEKNAEERFVLLWALQQMDSLGGDVSLLTNGHDNEDAPMVDTNRTKVSWAPISA